MATSMRDSRAPCLLHSMAGSRLASLRCLSGLLQRRCGDARCWRPVPGLSRPHAPCEPRPWCERRARQPRLSTPGPAQAAPAHTCAVPGGARPRCARRPRGRPPVQGLAGGLRAHARAGDASAPPLRAVQGVPPNPRRLSRARARPRAGAAQTCRNNLSHARPGLCSASLACCTRACCSPRCFRAVRQHSEQHAPCRSSDSFADCRTGPAARRVRLACWPLRMHVLQHTLQAGVPHYPACYAPLHNLSPLPPSLPLHPPIPASLPCCSFAVGSSTMRVGLNAARADGWGFAGRAGPAREHGAAAAAAAERRPPGLGGRGVGKPAGRAAAHLLQPLAQHGADPRGRLRHGGAPASPHPLSLPALLRHPPTSPARPSSP